MNNDEETPTMKRSLLSLLLLLLLLAAFVHLTFGTANVAAQGSATSSAQEKLDDEGFVPSEEIPVEGSVSFPTDI